MDTYSDKSFYKFEVRDAQGNLVHLSNFAGSVCLVVNTASKCGFTPQYKGLEELYKKYLDRGFVVMAFPSNDFGNQEPGSDSEIKEFCEIGFGVTFPLFTKASVKGDQKQPVYKFLTESNPKFSGDPGWNFVKFLVSREGKVVNRFSSLTGPTSKKLTKAIEKELDACGSETRSK
ncbi:MAG: glutathione peroxidase [Bdellovibrionales bacterium]|nr:glutathione peroxidase [Bdellovibrionales bacterium]